MVNYNGVWGTVCDNGWTLNAAQVVCRELSFGPAIFARIDSYYGKGNGQIWLDNVTCVGDESSIKQCEHLGWGIHNCDHSDDAGVQCSPEGILTLTRLLNVRRYRTIRFILDNYRGPLLLSKEAREDDKTIFLHAHNQGTFTIIITL